jgi:hypothetical protein
MARKPVLRAQRSLNERLVSLEILRQVLTLRFSLRVRKLVVDAINDTEVPVARMIRDAIRADAGLRSPNQVRELDELIRQLNNLRRPVWQAMAVTADTEFRQLAEAEPEEERDLFGFLLPGLSLAVPVGVAIAAAAAATPFHGRTLAQWFQDAADDDAKRIRQAIYLGVAAGESPAAIARRVVGTAKAMGRDGVTQISRNHIDTIVRSGTIHFSAYARDQFYRANQAAGYTLRMGEIPRLPVPPVRPVGTGPDPVQAEAARQAAQAAAAAGQAAASGKKVFALEQYVAVLDNRTTKLCRGLDGNRYKLGVGPIPPLHPNCRSMRILVLPDSIGGAVYDPGKYADWIRQQPFEVQVMLMGSTKANKLSDKDLADEAFEDYGAKPMSLEQVRKETRRLMEFY